MKPGFPVRALSIVLPMLASTPVVAWDGVVSGTINSVEITAAHNLGFRITLVGIATMCSGGTAIAYLNGGDSNYEVYVAALLAARAQGSSVTVYTNLENGYCHIGHIAIAG
jgi:hypothetical protein